MGFAQLGFVSLLLDAVIVLSVDSELCVGCKKFMVRLYYRERRDFHTGIFQACSLNPACMQLERAVCLLFPHALQYILPSPCAQAFQRVGLNMMET